MASPYDEPHCKETKADLSHSIVTQSENAASGVRTAETLDEMRDPSSESTTAVRNAELHFGRARIIDFVLAYYAANIGLIAFCDAFFDRLGSPENFVGLLILLWAAVAADMLATGKAHAHIVAGLLFCTLVPRIRIGDFAFAIAYGPYLGVGLIIPDSRVVSPTIEMSFGISGTPKIPESGPDLIVVNTIALIALATCLLSLRKATRP
jgi:hypothetical protein